MIWSRQAEVCEFKRVSLRICSWNVAAQLPTSEKDDSVWRRWLGGADEDEADLLIIGLQEIVDLAFMSANNANSTAAIELWARELKRRLSREYRLIHSAAMVGLGLLVFVKGLPMREALSWPAEEAVKTGLAGMHGNKGALIWRAFVHDTPLVFAVAHLAAGQKSTTERNSDAATILRNASLPAVNREFAFPTGNTGSRVLDYAGVFLFGDLNYRVEAGREACESQVRTGQLAALLEYDQLRSQVAKPELILSAFVEAPLKFAPTYKYDQGTVSEFDSSEKRRVPAWCDRILMHSKGCHVLPLQYDSVPQATASDHKPIFGTFEVNCRIVDEARLQRLLQ
jgi:endonuclease/exonuclease/phosphatase family metal-dependent hydrolase